MCSASEQILPGRLPSLSSGCVVLDDFDGQVGVLPYYVVGGLVCSWVGQVQMYQDQYIRLMAAAQTGTLAILNKENEKKKNHFMIFS